MADAAKSNLGSEEVEEAAVLGQDAVGCHLLRGAAAHGVIGAFDCHAAVALGEEDGAVLGVIGDVPDAGACLDERLVAVCVKGGGEAAFCGVLIQAVGGVDGAVEG